MATTTTAPTLFTLPAHLRANLAALVACGIAPPPLQDRLRTALAAADLEEMEDELEEADVAPATGTTELALAPEEDGAADRQDEPVAAKLPQRKPPTVDGDLLDMVAAWAGAERERIASAGLDYSFVGLLAGTEVYLPPRQRALAAAADKALADKEKANPFLPNYMSPTPPSLGSEYRQLSRQVATVLNVLFSVFGVAGGAYYAARSVGWTREGAIVLGILGGVVVGIADSVLVWIFKVRLKKDRRDTAWRRVRMNKGSGGIPGSAKVLAHEDEEESKAIEGPEGEGEAASTATAKRTLRLRRKPLS